jgi:hypothetical protein
MDRRTFLSVAPAAMALPGSLVRTVASAAHRPPDDWPRDLGYITDPVVGPPIDLGSLPG